MAWFSQVRKMATRSARFRPELEGLEDRTVLSTLNISNGVMTFSDMSLTAHNVRINIEGTQYVISDGAPINLTGNTTGASGSGTMTVRIPLSSVNSMFFSLGPVSDTIVVQGLRDELTISGNGGSDAIVLGDPTSGLDRFTSAASVHVNGGSQFPGGQDTLTINDAGSANGNVYWITGDAVYRASLAITYERVELLTIEAGSQGDSFQISGTSITTTLQGNAGDDHFSPGLQGFNWANLDELAGAVHVEGGAGSDWLSYSFLNQGVSVDLVAGTATGITSLSGINNVAGSDYSDELYGTSGSNILIGHGGDDILRGSAGRDILIGGTGADDLEGGSGDDILLAGTTHFDSSPTILELIRREWASNNDYTTRVAHICGQVSGGINDVTSSYLLPNGQWITQGPYFFDTNTVGNDGADDELTGGAGRDWFWSSSGEITDFGDNDGDGLGWASEPTEERNMP